MPKTANKISLLIEDQLPAFISDEYELFSKFVQKYYEQLELQGQPLDIAHNIATYRNIDFYEKRVLQQETKLAEFAQDTDTTITVVDASAFPDSGYLKVNEEICFYKERTDTKFLQVSRGVSGNTTLGDLYSESTFVTTQAADHPNGSTVQNISNLFLFALVKSFEAQYLPDFPVSYLNENIDQRTLIKNIGDFYKSKGTANSIKFLFKCLVPNDQDPDVLYPRDYTLKSSESTWSNNYSLKVKIISGSPESFIGKQIIQNLDGNYASATIDNVLFSGTYDGIDLYEFILAEETVNGEFVISSKTKLTGDIDINSTVVDVFSTMGWGETGKFYIENEVFTFESKNVNQFTIKTRSGSASYSAGSLVYDAAEVNVGTDSILILGVLYSVAAEETVPYAVAGEKLEISKPGFETTSPKIVDLQNNVRWKLSTGKVSGLPLLNSGVSAIFEDESDYYITSSGFPDHPFTLNVPVKDQRQLRIIPKVPTSTTEIYKTNDRDVGVFVNGVVAMSAKDTDKVFNGPIERIDVINRGSGYVNAPFVLVDGVPNLARARMAGQVVESIVVDTPGNYQTNPQVEVVSGRNGLVSPIITNGEITSLVVTDPGEFYSSAPVIRIIDLAGKGRFADYTAVVSPAGQIVDFIQNNPGSGYTPANISVDVIAVGSGATAESRVQQWTRNRYNKYASELDGNNGYFIANKDASQDNGYAYYASPTALRQNDNGSNHSPILGFAYDGNPIYGAFGFSDALDSNSSITRMDSSYTRNIARPNGPTVSSYPLGSFFEDYTYVHLSGHLDQNNGRFCVTPDYPEGTYAYFITVDSNDDPQFPYILGDNYYSVPRDSNYKQALSHRDVPKSSSRLRTADIDKNGELAIAVIDEINRGNVSGAEVYSSASTFSVGSEVIIDNTSTGGFGATAEVSSVKGRQVESIESQSTKALLVELSNIGYLFDGDTITQDVTGATGEIVGNVFSGKKFALRNVTGNFSDGDVLSSSTTVLNLILDKNASYTVGSTLEYTDGVASVLGQAEVLETTISKNSVIVRLISGSFSTVDNFFIRSSNLLDTTGADVFETFSLSSNLRIFTTNRNVAILKTSDDHGVGVNDMIDIDISPDDSTTTSTYYVRSRIYQKIKFNIPVAATVLTDTGVGKLTLLTGGADYMPDQMYAEAPLLGGSGEDATARMVVGPEGYVISVEPRSDKKGTGYKRGDVLTVSATYFSKSDLTTGSVEIRVDHVGLGAEETKINVVDGTGFTADDFISIGSEIVKVVNRTDNVLTVLRGQLGTTAVEHFDGAALTQIAPAFNLPKGFALGSTPNDPVIEEYDTSTQVAEVVFGYNQTLSTINAVSLSTVFFDQSVDQKLVRILEIDQPQSVFELSTDNVEFTRNPVIDIKKFYKYNFDVSHPSMNGRAFDISPSINYNIVTPERTINNSIVDLKLGYGSRTGINNYATKQSLQYSKYYYFDKNGLTNSETGLLNVVDDPLQGLKSALYITSRSVVYDTNITAPHDGSGVIKYDSMSQFSIGEIKSVNVINSGSEYRRLPIVSGVLPTPTYVATAITEIEDGSLSAVQVTYNGSNYSKAKAIVEGNALLEVVQDQGRVTGLIIKHAGSGYTTAPTVKIVESDQRIYLSSETIGVPRNVRIVNNGGSYHNDKTLSSTIRSNYIFKLSNFKEDSFGIGETIIQRNSGVETARAKVVSWRRGSNILVVKDVTGLFRENIEILGISRRNTAVLDTIAYSKFNKNIKTYFDNIGSFQDDQGVVSSSNQRLTDSYYYQDYSYVVKSKTSINSWRDLIKKTTHPAGFQLFGEVLIESDTSVPMSPNTKTVNTSIVQLWDPNKNKITVVSTKKQVTTSVIHTEQLKIERGAGSISLDTFDTSEIRAKQLFLNGQFTGAFTDRGNLEGRTLFTLVDSNGATITPYNEQALTITLDGILQEPGRSYTVKGNKITFAAPPLGPSVKDGQQVPGVTFHCRYFEFKTAELNARYLKRVRNIFQREGTWIDAANQLAMNRAFIQSETLGYIQAEYPNLTWGTLGTKCYRDIGLVVDALEHDLRFGGNSKTIAATEKYFIDGVLAYIDGELEASIDAYDYAVRLCKLAMRNWDFVDRQVSWTPGTDLVTVSNTDNIAIGMKISAGRAFNPSTIVTEIVDERTIRISQPSLNISNTLQQLVVNQILPTDQSTAPILQIAPGIFIQIDQGATYTISLPQSGQIDVSANAQMTFIWSGLNNGTFYDASTLIEANKINIQREAAHRIYDKYPKFTYPRVPEAAYRFKDGRRLIYDNLQDIVTQTIAELNTKYGQQFATDKCARDLKIVIAAVAEDTGRGGNSAIIAATNRYFTNHDALDGERTESIYGFNFARDLCIEAINNRGTVQDPNIILVPDCTNVNSAVTTLFGILTDALTNNTAPTTTVNTGITEWVEAEEFCFRDTGILVDAIVYSLRWGGTQKVVEFAEAYFNNYKLNHIKGELLETIYANEVARDLMILAMRNNISGSTIIAPITDPLVRTDSATPYCADVESAITSYINVVTSILQGGPNRILATPENESATGYWSSLQTYVNKNILPDPLLVNATLSECEEVASSLDSLYDGIKSTLVTGPGTVEISLPDYTNNENKIFDLYYEDGGVVDLDDDENLFVSISGILQHDGAYFIDKTQTPNRIVFSGAPIWNQGENIKTVQEPLAVERIAMHGVGNYTRCKLDTSGILDGSAGPFIILRKEDNKVQNIDDADFVFVFIDGVMQRLDAYNINGPAIRFTRKVYKYNKIELILLYGRELDPVITLHDFEANTYLNRLTLSVSDSSPNSYDNVFTFTNVNYDKERFVYQKDGSVKNIIGKIKKLERVDDRNIALVVAGQNPVFNGSSELYFSTDYVNFSDEVQLSGVTSTLAYQLDENGNRRMQRDSSPWLYDSVLADKSFYIRKNGLARLNAGDRVRLDGETDFRTIKKLPQYVSPKDYRDNQNITSEYFGSVTTTNYNGDIKGVGLSATAVMDGDKVARIDWNRKDLQLFYDEGIIQPTTAYGYDTAPVLHFLPEDQQGGGAKAEVIVSKGQIVDIVLIDGGSGYTEAPKIVTSRKYDLLKGNSRKIDSLVKISFANQISKKSPVAVAYFEELATGIEVINSVEAAVNFNGIGFVIEIDKVVDFSGTFLTKRETTIFTPPTVTSLPNVTAPSAGSDALIIIKELDRTIESQPLLTTTTARKFNWQFVAPDQFGPNAGSFQIFQNYGNIVSAAGIPISGLTFEELERYGITIDQFNDPYFKPPFATASINNYLTQLQTDDIPARYGGADIFDNSYISASGYPDPSPDGYYKIYNGAVFLYVSVPAGTDAVTNFRSNVSGSGTFPGTSLLQTDGIYVEWGPGPVVLNNYYSGDLLTGFANDSNAPNIQDRIQNKAFQTGYGYYDVFRGTANPNVQGIVLKPNFDISAYNNQIGQFKWIKNVDYDFAETNNIIYCNTDKLPASGTILVGREQMTYTSKLSDRLLGVDRGINGTPTEGHSIGEYIRLLS
nr:strucutural protein [uncultured Mediterranean phage uvMED]